MKAIVYKKYGSPKNLQLTEVAKPIPKEEEVLIKVHAVSLNASDYEMLTAKPAYIRMWGLFRPKYQILGSDIAGVVEAVGQKVTNFQPGDEVFGDIFESWGGLAEYVCAKENQIIHKPRGLSFAQAAAIPQAGVVALQGLQYNGGITTKKQVLINGAGGGSGTFAIQIAKSMGAEVTGVDNGSKLQLMTSLGADHVIDYTQEDFATGNKKYDFILDLVAQKPVLKVKKVLKENGTYAVVGGSIPSLLQVLALGGISNLFSTKKAGIVVHHQNRKDLAEMLMYHNSGKAIGVIGKKYTLANTPQAFQALAQGEALGKVVINI